MDGWQVRKAVENSSLFSHFVCVCVVEDQCVGFKLHAVVMCVGAS